MPFIGVQRIRSVDFLVIDDTATKFLPPSCDGVGFTGIGERTVAWKGSEGVCYGQSNKETQGIHRRHDDHSTLLFVLVVTRPCVLADSFILTLFIVALRERPLTVPNPAKLYVGEVSHLQACDGLFVGLLSNETRAIVTAREPDKPNQLQLDRYHDCRSHHGDDV